VASCNRGLCKPSGKVSYLPVRSVHSRILCRVICTILAASPLASATTYVSYVGDVGGSSGDPRNQGWSITGGGRSRAVNDGGVLGWELTDRKNNSQPTMSADFGASNVPAPGDPWTFAVTTRVLHGNGTESNQIQWSNGSDRYRVFIYEDDFGNIDISYSNLAGSPRTFDNYFFNDDGYHTWAIVHDGSAAKLTCDGSDVVTIGSIPAAGTARGVYIGGGSGPGRGSFYLTGASYDATLTPVVTTRPARVFADHMVLQRGEPVAIFGTDDISPGSQSISVSFGGQTKFTTTDGSGQWRVNLDSMSANSTGQDLVVTGSSTVMFSNILVGEVWLAAGQENMNFSVGASSNAPHPSTYPLIRMCNWEATVGAGSSQVYGSGEFDQLDRDDFYAGSWQEIDAASVSGQSAVGYFFAHELAASLGVPVGIVDLSVDGTSTEAYIPAAAHLADFYLRIPFEKPDSSPSLGQATTERIAQNLGSYAHPDPGAPHPHPFAPGFLHETGIRHLVPFTFKGVIWYQGESNAAFSNGLYARNGKWVSDYQFHLLTTLVDSWRSAFQNPGLPFYQVQLPRINQPERIKWPWYRDAQDRFAREVPGVETAVITDLGSEGLTPLDKEPVAQRLARIARQELYGQAMEASGPRLTQQVISGDQVILHFDHTGNGLISSDGAALRHFEIAGPDRNFVPAPATIVGTTVVVSSPAVPNPVAVRYAWERDPDVNLFNDNDVDLPAGPFRTDDWMFAGLGRPIRVACIGDSITFGLGIPDPADTYPARLQDLLGTTLFEVQSFGLSGAKIFTSSLKYENSPEFANALAFQPDIVICNLGLNDVNDWGQITRDGFLTEYRHLMDAFASLPTDPALIIWHEIAPIFTSVAGSPDLLALIELIGECASYMGVKNVDMSQPLAGHPEWFFGDGIHPNETGARKIAEETFLYLHNLDAMDPWLTISEFMAINTGTLTDENGDLSSWLEISNLGSTGAAVGGTYLTDEIGDLTRWQIPPGTFLEPASAMVLYASGKDRAVPGDELHTNFILPETSGSLAMVAADGVTVLDFHDLYPIQYADRSYGRDDTLTSAQGVFYPTPTPGSLNGTGGLPPFANWKDLYGVSSDSEDLDRDGISAIVEFFNGSRPDSAASASPAVPVMISDGGFDYFGVEFRLASGLPGLSAQLESPPQLELAPQLLTSNAVIVGAPILVSSIDNGDGTKTVTYRLETPINDADNGFLRVKFDYSE